MRFRLPEGYDESWGNKREAVCASASVSHKSLGSTWLLQRQTTARRASIRIAASVKLDGPFSPASPSTEKGFLLQCYVTKRRVNAVY